jgi:hypothetical protein
VDRPGRRIEEGIDIKFQVILEESSERFEDAAGQVSVILFLDDLLSNEVSSTRAR